MLYKLKGIENVEFNGKKILVRADLDVPIINGQIEDDSRLKACLDTLDLILAKNGTVIVIGHLGRPNGVDQRYSFQPVADWFVNHYSSTAIREKIGEFDGWKIKDNLFLLENLRFYDGEKKNDPVFSKKLANLADVYVNDAFGNSHRAHASMVGVATLLPHLAGIYLKKEINALSKVLENPKRPLVAIIGGAKIETKLPMVKKMNSLADTILVGGLIAEELRSLLQSNPQELEGGKAEIMIADLTADGKDITPESTEKFIDKIKGDETVVWNGSLGYVEGGFEKGTKEVAKAIVDSDAFSVVGGGDTVGYLKKLGILEKFSFVSTGGGAMLEFLSGEKLPGIEVLKK